MNLREYNVRSSQFAVRSSLSFALNPTTINDLSEGVLS